MGTEFSCRDALRQIGGQVFAELLGIPITKLGQQNVAREVGSYFNEFYRQKPIFDPSTEGSLIGAQADGKWVRMIPSEKPQAVKDPKPRVFCFCCI